MATLVTGAAGFIGFHVSMYLLARGETVVGLDNLNDYYDVSLKEARLAEINAHGSASSFSFERVDVADRSGLDAVFVKHDIDRVVHLAAQAGVRYSLENPHAYIESNVVGFMNVLESCRAYEVKHLVYASSSSVYGNNKKVPYSVDDNVDHPISIYAASKKSNELMAHVYSHLYGLPTTGLRFFTVYGPWGRPDMSPFIFARAIFEDKPIKLFNNGDHQRDFTYVDDIVEGIVRTLDAPTGDTPPYAVHNIGNNNPVNLRDYVELFERAIGKKAIIELAPMQPGDVHTTYANVDSLRDAVGYEPSTPLEEGIARFVAWYRAYFER